MQFSEPTKVVNMDIYSETHICTVVHICKYKYFTYTYMDLFSFLCNVCLYAIDIFSFKITDTFG